MSKLTYLWSQGMVDKIAEKVAEETIGDVLDQIVIEAELMENRVLFEGTPFEVDEGNYEYMPKRPQHVIDEEKVDEEILNRHDRRQMEMFDDPYGNWSGHR
jgi:hypothetical protein